MILKLRVPEYVGSVVKSGGWKYVDGVERVHIYGPIMDDRDGPTKGDPRVFTSYDELTSYIANAWGDTDSRSYDFELWPEWARSEGYARYVTVAVLYLTDDRIVLAVLTEDCYLLGSNGQNVDRLCASGMAFPRG